MERAGKRKSFAQNYNYNMPEGAYAPRRTEETLPLAC